jgi:hypothetical protein
MGNGSAQPRDGGLEQRQVIAQLRLASTSTATTTTTTIASSGRRGGRGGAGRSSAQDIGHHLAKDAVDIPLTHLQRGETIVAQ